MVVDQVEEVREVAGEGRAQVPAAQWLETVVLARRELAQDICSFELGLPGGAPLPDFTAGAHVRVELGDGLNRAYSICSDPSERSRYVIAVLREPASRGGSAAMHDRVHVGSVLRISRPSNQFSLHEGEAHSVLMAGGIGVTPILAMARTLRRRGATFEFHYASRSRERAAFADALDAGAVGPGVQLYFDAEPAKPLDIARVLGAAAARSPNSHVYVCGPAGFIEAVRSTASRLGWPSERIHFELFGGAPAPQANTGEFEVRLVRSGISLAVPANQSVLDVLNAAGIRIDTSCEQGVCGVCVTRVLEGTPDHRDMYLTDEERKRGDCFTPCCSRSKSPVLAIDL